MCFPVFIFAGVCGGGGGFFVPLVTKFDFILEDNDGVLFSFSFFFLRNTLTTCETYTELAFAVSVSTMKI